MRLCVSIVHSSLNSAGGSERVAVAAMRAFVRAGFEVVLAAGEPTDWGFVRRVWGDVPRPSREVYLLPFRARMFAVYLRFATWPLVARLRGECDVVVNTHGDLLPVNADVTYMHFPTFLVWERGFSKYSGGLWRLYFAPYYDVQRRLARRGARGTVLVTNSRFSRAVIGRYLGRRALIVYPPVEVDRYLRLEPPSGGRRFSVVSLGRFSPEKRYEFVVEVARRLPDVEFHLCGSVSPVNRWYFEKIRGLVESYGLGNVFLHPNIPQDRLEEIMAESRVLLHAMVEEHFGIAVVEGQAAGLVPVVHRSGGVWTDVVEFGRYGFGYRTLGEAVGAVKMALREQPRLERAVRRSAVRFSVGRFERRIVRLVEALARRRG